MPDLLKLREPLGTSTENSYRGPRVIAFPTTSHGVLLALDCPSIPGRCQVYTELSDDGGLSWSAAVVLTAVSWSTSDPPANTFGPNNLVFSNADDGYAYGPDLYQTRDGGRTWRQLPVNGQVAAAAAVSDGVWLAVWHGCGGDGCTGWDLETVDAQGQVRALPKQPAPIAPPPGVSKVGVPTQLLRPDAAHRVSDRVRQSASHPQRRRELDAGDLPVQERLRRHGRRQRRQLDDAVGRLRS